MKNEDIINFGLELDPHNLGLQLARLIANITPPPNISNNYYQFVTAGACVGDNYPRSIEVIFPKECWELHGWTSIKIPISELLRWAAEDSPDYAECFEAIRKDFYPYPDEDYCSDEWNCEPDINWAPDEKRMEEIRRELAAKAELRRSEEI